jgi:hypothetical protein
MILPTGRLNKGSKRRETHRTFEVEPHSERQARISANYHGKTIDRMNPSRRKDNAVRYPQTGLGG